MDDYLTEYFIPSLSKSLERQVSEKSRCCGLCRHWEEHYGWIGYGDCNLTQKHGLGFDCAIWKACSMFEPSMIIEVSLNVRKVTR